LILLTDIFLVQFSLAHIENDDHIFWIWTYSKQLPLEIQTKLGISGDHKHFFQEAFFIFQKDWFALLS